MATPLSRRRRSARRQLIQTPQDFELHQLLRLLLRTNPDDAPSIVIESENCTAPCVRNVVPAARRQPSIITVDVGLLPTGCVAEHATAAVAAAHDLWETSHPFAALERDASSGKSFIDECASIGLMPCCEALPKSYAAYAAGCFRRRAGVEVALVVEDYFGVPVSFEPLDACSGQLRIGPLTFDEYTEFLSDESGAGAQRHLAELTAALLGPAIEVEVVLILQANEVPPCIPGTIGAVVGLAAWPRPHRQKCEDRQQAFWIRNRTNAL